MRSGLLACRIAAAASLAMAGCASAPSADSTLTQIPVVAQTSATAVAPAYRLTSGDELDIKIIDAPLAAAGRSPEELQAEVRERYQALAGADQQREYLIHANDELEIKFPFYQQLDDQMRVRPDGKIQVQLAGTLQAEGLSPEELKLELRQRYMPYLKEPELTVIVRSATSQAIRTATGTARGGMSGLQPIVSLRSFQTPQVFVTGEVARAGMLAYTPGLTLLQALAEAGGHLPSGDVTKIVILRKTADQTAQLLRPGLTRTYRAAPTLDVVLQPYDVLLVPPTKAENLAQSLDRYVYKLFAPIKNSTFGYVYGSTKVY
jgi:polysaccharide export outer membrane protein